MTKSYKCFTKNIGIIGIMLALLILALAITFSLLSFDMPLWSILLASGIALCILAALLTIFIRLRVRVDSNGITVPISLRSKRFLAWSGITDVQIDCSLGKHMYYKIKFISDNSTVELRLVGEYAPNLIKEFSRDCDEFNKMFLSCLEKAETYC